MRNWFLVDGERMLLTEDEAEEYDGDGCDVVAERDGECTCQPDPPKGTASPCWSCRRYFKDTDISYWEIE